MRNIVKSIDGINFTLAAETKEAAEAARITLTDLAGALGYTEKARLKDLANRHTPELAEFGISTTVVVMTQRGNGAQVPVGEPTFNPDQAAYLALSSETPQGRACRVRILKAYKALLAEFEQMTKPLTHIQMLAAQAQAMADLEARQLEQEQRVSITEAGLAALEAAKAQSEAEAKALGLLPPASADAPPETEGELTVAVLRAWGFAHAGAYQAAYRMLYTAVLSRATRIDLRARLKNAKGRRLADVIDSTGKAGAIYAIARELFVDGK